MIIIIIVIIINYHFDYCQTVSCQDCKDEDDCLHMEWILNVCIPLPKSTFKKVYHILSSLKTIACIFLIANRKRADKTPF